MSREREIVRWVGRLGAVSIGQIGERFEVGRSVGYEQVRRLINAGLLERIGTLPGDPSLITATSEGLSYAGLSLSPARIRIGELDHWLTCADVAIELERRHDPERVLTERELRVRESLSRRPIASAKLGETVNCYWRLHYPDLIVTAEERPTVYEIELTVKSRKRLETIVKAWRRARHVERCMYLCAPGAAHEAVSAAVRRVGAGERVNVLELTRDGS
jgi:hypothetical protein